MTAEYACAPFPGFLDPDDWRHVMPVVDPDEDEQLAAVAVVARVSADHEARHGLREHPWCEWCEVRVREHNGVGNDWDHQIPADYPPEVLAMLAQLDPSLEDFRPRTPRESLRAELVDRACHYLSTQEEPNVYDPAQDSPALARADQRAADERALRLHQEAQQAQEAPVPATPEGLDPLLALEVDKELNRLRIRAEAKRLYEVENRPEAPPFDAGTLEQILARPAEPAMRVEGLIPWEGSTLLTAQRKTGKTTAILNLTRCLLTGEPFLGSFDVKPLDGTVALLNYEVSGHQIARWAHEHGVPRDRLNIVNLRGRRNPLGDQQDRAELAAMLRAAQVEAVVVDPFGRAFTGVNQDNNGEVGMFLADLDRFARTEVGARDLVLTNHAGWNAERSRGASTLEDWPDVMVTMTRNDDDERFLRAEGRDVSLDEDRLDFDPTTRLLALSGAGSRQQRKKQDTRAELAVLAVAAARESPGISHREMAKTVRKFEDAPAFQDVELRAAASLAVKNKQLRTEPGPHRSTLHYVEKVV